MNFVEELRLQNPLLLARAAAEAVDAVAERAVALLVEEVDDLRGELLVARGPADLLVQVDEVRLVDARRRRVDDDEHLRREILGLAVEDHAGDVDGRRLVGALVHVELERGGGAGRR